MTDEEELQNEAKKVVTRMEPDDMRVNPELNKLVRDALIPEVEKDREMMAHPDFNPLIHGHPVTWKERYKAIRKKVIEDYMAEQRRATLGKSDA